LYALDTTGKVKWIFQPSGYYLSRAAVDNGIVYVMNYVVDHYRLYAVDLKTGQLKWQTEIEQGNGCYPIVKNGLVYTSGGYLNAFDALTGAKKWAYASTTHHHVVLSDKVYTYRDSNICYLNIHDAKTGALIKRSGTFPDNVQSMNIGNGLLYVVIEDPAGPKVAAYDTVNFSQKWSVVEDYHYRFIA
jgi:outer membrane protein assembly factor BamB